MSHRHARLPRVSLAFLCLLAMLALPGLPGESHAQAPPPPPPPAPPPPPPPPKPYAPPATPPPAVISTMTLREVFDLPNAEALGGDVELRLARLVESARSTPSHRRTIAAVIVVTRSLTDSGSALQDLDGPAKARAEGVKQWLVGRGIPPILIATVQKGPLPDMTRGTDRIEVEITATQSAAR